MSNTDALTPKRPKALVKGAGPSGLAAALALADAGYSGNDILVVERRPQRELDQGRKNMVAIRPEGLRRLDEFGCLTYARSNGWITDLKAGKTVNEWNSHLEGGGIFDWPIGRYSPDMVVLVDKIDTKDKKENVDEDKEKAEADDDESDDWVHIDDDQNSREDISDVQEKSDELKSKTSIYNKPKSINEQVPCAFINLGHLEDALYYAVKRKDIIVRFQSTLSLLREPNKIEMTDEMKAQYRAFLSNTVPNTYGMVDLGVPDLIVCASGKNDLTLGSQLRFDRHIGAKLELENLPPSKEGRRRLELGPEHEIESQLFSVFGVKNPRARMGIIDHVVRKEGTGQPEQPVTEIEMRHASASHCLIQLPRGLSTEQINDYITKRVNVKLGMNFANIEDMRKRDALVWGDPLTPIDVETSTAPQYVFGNNVVLVGDAAMSCSPSSGIGADVGMTVDSTSVYLLARRIRELKEMEGLDSSEVLRRKTEIFEDFNRRRAEASVIWSQGSRMFYITSEEARDILSKQRTSAHEVLPSANMMSRDW